MNNRKLIISDHARKRFCERISPNLSVKDQNRFLKDAFNTANLPENREKYKRYTDKGLFIYFNKRLNVVLITKKIGYKRHVLVTVIDCLSFLADKSNGERY